jgi:hypothetical protein
MTANARRTPRRGTFVSMRHKAYALEASTRDRRLHYEDASFTRSFGPCSSILTMHSGVTRSGGAGAGASRLGKPGEPGGTSTGAQAQRTERGSSRVTVFARKRRGTFKKRKAVKAVVPTRIGEFRVWLPARRSAIAEVDRRRSGPK